MEDTRWLTDEEQQVWRRLVHLVTVLPAALDAQLQRDARLTHFEYLVLAILSETPGRSRRMTDLAGLVNGSQSRLSHLVGRLERRGLIHRERSTEDRRGSVAVLTEAGWAAVVAAAPGHVAHVRSLVFDQLTPEQVRQLGDTLAAMLDRIAPADSCPGPTNPC
ncbi:MarR family transcriptional regulator [Micromonospora globispora]|uniref:MarR family winged helix-turn-helix transcriptional regulator n=1 Tax=Micromonospora globispora TaxID=1450148 RepID=UPI000D6ED668|nr:MarR family transcriptional regulator [Micromonospora globispora]PWU49163.1 MarR family transcriptional regulator [Micromonospora globispora]